MIFYCFPREKLTKIMNILYFQLYLLVIFSQTNDEAYERCLKLHGKVVADSFDVMRIGADILLDDILSGFNFQSTAKDYLIETLKAFKHNSNTDNSTLCS